MKSRSCSLCEYGSRGEIDKNNVGAKRPYYCRFKPPVPMAIPTPNGMQLIATFPSVDEDAWCGEFKAKLNRNNVAQIDGKDVEFIRPSED